MISMIKNVVQMWWNVGVIGRVDGTVEQELRPDCSKFEIYLLNNGELLSLWEEK